MPDFIVNGTAPDFSVTFKNHNVEMAGRFYLMMESLDEGGRSFILQRQGITLAKDEVSERRFYKSKVTAPQRGKFRLHVYYESNLFADELIELELPEEKLIEVIAASQIQLAQR